MTNQQNNPDNRPLGGAQPPAQGSYGTYKRSNEQVTVMQDPNDPDSVIIRTRKRERKKHQKKKRMNPVLKVFLIVLAVIVGIAAAAGIAFAIAVHQGNVNLHQLFNAGDTTIEAAPAKTSDEGQIVEYKGHTYKYNENIVSMVLIGHDDESAYGYVDKSLADTIILFTLDTSTNKVRATVVPRNSWVGVDLYDDNGNYATTDEMQITLSHGVNLPTTAQCAENTVKSVSRIFYNMPIVYYFDFGKEVVAKSTEAIGGVQVEALETIPGEPYVAGDDVLLEGDAAYRYVQYRDVDVDESALDRQQRQVQFMKAFAAKVANLGAQGLINVYTSVSGDIVTNLGPSEVAYLATCFATGDNAQLEISSLKGKTKVGREADGIEYERYYLDEDSVMENTLAAFYTQID